MYSFTPLPGYFTPFPHGTCPLSVTREYLGLAGGPAGFTANFTGSLLLGVSQRRRRVFVYGGITLCAGPSQVLRLTTMIFYSSLVRQNQHCGPTTPDTQRLPAITRMWFGLFRFRSPLLTESRLLSLPVGTEMFHFPTFPPHALCVQAWVTGHDSCRVSPFGNPRIKAWSAAPRGLSQPPTSFIGSWCQGIHRAPLLTWPQRCSRPLCSSQGTGDDSDVSPRTPCGAVRCSGVSGLRIRHTDTPEGGFPLPQDSTACLRICLNQQSSFLPS